MLSALFSPLPRPEPLPLQTFGAYQPEQTPVMLDFIILRAVFRDVELDHRGQPFPLSDEFLCSLDTAISLKKARDSEVTNIDIPWDSVDSGFGTLAVKVSKGHPHKAGGWPYVEIKCSPAKLAQGHNVYGPASISHGARLMLDALQQQMPILAGELDWSSWEVLRIDVNAPSWCPSDNPNRPDHKAMAFLRSICKVNAGHRKAATDGSHDKDDASAVLTMFRSSVYWSPKSDVLRLKCYCKGYEFRRALKALERTNPALFNQLFNSVLAPLLPQVSGMLRWEAQFMKKYFTRRGISTRLIDFCNCFDCGDLTLFDLWQAAFRPIFKSFEGCAMHYANNSEVCAAIEKAGRKVVYKSRKKAYFNELERARVMRDMLTQGASFERDEVLGSDCGRLHFKCKSQSEQGKAAAKTYLRIVRDGYQTARAEMMAAGERTWYDHRAIILRAGISEAQLQQYEGGGVLPESVPFVQFIPAVFHFAKTA